ncbi:MAG: hypothetical protein ABJ327_23910 [Litoreibacter sp.]
MTNELTIHVTKNIEAVVTPVSQEVSLDTPIFALNWFNTRSLTLYNIYNILASRSVTKVGGEVVIKGKVLNVLAGDPNDRRDILLIVRYPSGPRFLSMLQSTYFKLVSVLRTAAVAQFTFGFTHPTAHASAKPDHPKEMAYMIHHYRGADRSNSLQQLASEHGINVVYMGQTVAHLATRTPDTPDAILPVLSDGIAIFQANAVDQLKSFFSSEAFLAIATAHESSFSATFRRLL